MKHGVLGPFQMNIQPCSRQRRPTDNTFGVESNMKGSISSPNESRCIGHSQHALVVPLAVQRSIGILALRNHLVSVFNSFLATRSEPHPVSINHKAMGLVGRTGLLSARVAAAPIASQKSSEEVPLPHVFSSQIEVGMVVLCFLDSVSYTHLTLPTILLV